MDFFPAYIKLNDKKILLVGGGKIATDKLMHLLDFTYNISVLAIIVNDNIKELSIKSNFQIVEKEYEKNDIDGFDMVIVATDDIKLQKIIYEEAKKKHILCNAVDSPDYCDFIFASYIKKKDLVIAVSTSGTSPAVAKYLRRYIEKLLPKDIGDFLIKMKNCRKILPKGILRMKFLDEKAKRYFSKKGKDNE